LCGGFAFGVKFKRRDDLHDKAMDRCRQFFIGLQQTGRDWLSLGTTKTGSFTGSKAIRPRAMSDTAQTASIWIPAPRSAAAGTTVFTRRGHFSAACWWLNVRKWHQA
jgi:hypothetical protein